MSRLPRITDDAVFATCLVLLAVSVAGGGDAPFIAGFGLLMAYVAYGADRALLREGVRSRAATLPRLLAVLAVLTLAAPRVLDWKGVPANSLLLVTLAAMLPLFASLFWPSAVIAVLGGPSVEWRLLRASLELRREANRLVASPDPAAERAFRSRLTALDAFRTPATDEYITLLQRWNTSWLDGSEGADEWSHLAELERGLARSLKVEPSWFRDVAVVNDSPTPRARLKP